MRKSLVRRPTQAPDIPTASTADVAFLLILFFMVTTVFRATSLHLKISLPKAQATERILIRRNLANLWLEASGKVYVDDAAVPMELLNAKMAAKIAENPDLVTILKIDEGTNYGIVDQMLDQLKEARAFKITFATEFSIL